MNDLIDQMDRLSRLEAIDQWVEEEVRKAAQERKELEEWRKQIDAKLERYRLQTLKQPE